ncbi:urease accessory protein UreD [Candidatus Nitrosotenuis sp. DW1]|uniref:urease accessory protein UreD n=1 Tax=Candidatus Nitrosotenuis sp. DW1 TaxID=2259672 RepID=UPI0015C84BB6|nr:urease accessory protein UreD [Candidatus Nitrosotenuis sp. DW1]QLH09605.1 urease accessory protein UreD [Candidatus Nitrosotenuis sp. DW1]
MEETSAEMLQHNEAIKQLGVGRSGKNGKLKIILDVDSSGKTRIKEKESAFPLSVQKEIYYDQFQPNMTHVYMISSSGGILQGDKYAIDITLEKNALAHITTQGATRIYGMNASNAIQVVNVSLDDGAYLEFIPDQIIPYRDSRFYQEISFKVHDNATMIYSEIVSPGRIGMGEIFDYDICYLRSVGKNQKDVLRFTDYTKIEPKKMNLQDFGLLEQKQITASMYILAKTKDVETIIRTLEDKIKNSSEIEIGWATMTKENGVLIRILGNTTRDVIRLVYDITKIVRKAVLDSDFHEIRKT